MEIGNIIPHIEALIFASDKPLTSMEITELINNAFGFMEEKLTLEQIQTSLDGIIEKYASEFYPFEVRESGGGWQFLTKRDFHKTVAQLNGEKFLKRLSSAALETLAIIAYKQPITKGEIESIRGVSSDYSIQKLLEKELIIISGRNENMPGKPLVYSTSKTFMDYFGINSAEDLPKLKEIFAETMIEPTIITHGAGEVLPETEENVTPGAESSTPAGAGSEESAAAEAKLLIVGEDGQLIEHEGEQEEAQAEGTNEEAHAEEEEGATMKSEEPQTDGGATESEELHAEEHSAASGEPQSEEEAAETADAFASPTAEEIADAPDEELADEIADASEEESEEEGNEDIAGKSGAREEEDTSAGDEHSNDDVDNDEHSEEEEDTDSEEQAPGADEESTGHDGDEPHPDEDNDHPGNK